MSQINWKNLQGIFEKALSIPEEEREKYLDKTCLDDFELLKAAKKLLSADARNSSLEEDAYSIKLKNIDSQLIGTRIDGWNIKKQIGTGGMGSVFFAEKKSDGFLQQVALKIVKKGMDSESIVNRFRQERRILASLSHPNIARLIDGGVTSDGRPYFVMELVEGLPIDEYCDSNRLNISQRLVLFQKACDAVHYAHKNLIVHRDLKPSNIIITESGELKLLDFGIAKLLDDSEHPQNTRTEMQLHTPAYASPEQLVGELITTASDIYALGILFYEILSGRRPFEIKWSQKEYIDLILTHEPKKPSDALLEDSGTVGGDGTTKTIEEISNQRRERREKLHRVLSGDLDIICLTAMHLEPERRYTSASELAADIKRHLNGMPILARPDSKLYRLRKFLRRNIPSVIISSVALASIITLSIFYTIQLTKQRDIAIVERGKSEEVVDFVISLFKVSDPSESKGENVSARDLLDAGVIQIQTELSEQPAVRLMLSRVLGEVYYNLGSEKRAEEILTETLSEQKKLLGDNHLDVAITKIQLGFIYQDRGNLELAETLFLEALSTQQQLLDGDHFNLVETLNVLAFLEQTKGNYNKAESLFKDALNMARRLTEDDHEYIAETLKNLGGVMRILDRNNEAEVVLSDALKMQLRLYDGGPHPEIDDTKRELAGLLKNTRRFNEAKILYKEVISSQTKMLGKDHIEVAHVWNSYSQLLDDMGDDTGAIAANKTFIDIMLRAYPGPHPSLGAAYHNRALLLKNNDMLDEAIKSFTLSVDMQNAIGLPKRHVNRSYPLSGMADVYLDQKEYLKAKIAYSEVLSLRRESFSESHILITESKSNLAAALTGLKEFSEAERLLVECYQQFIKTRNKDDPRTERAARRLVHLYKEKGEIGKVKEFEQRLKKDGVNL